MSNAIRVVFLFEIECEQFVSVKFLFLLYTELTGNTKCMMFFEYLPFFLICLILKCLENTLLRSKLELFGKRPYLFSSIQSVVLDQRNIRNLCVSIKYKTKSEPLLDSEASRMLSWNDKKFLQNNFFTDNLSKFIHLFVNQPTTFSETEAYNGMDTRCSATVQDIDSFTDKLLV